MDGDEYVTARDCEAISTRIFAKLDSIERRLFKDNGTLSIQTRLDRHEQFIRVILWALAVIGGAILVYLVAEAGVLLRTLLQSGAG